MLLAGSHEVLFEVAIDVQSLGLLDDVFAADDNCGIFDLEIGRLKVDILKDGISDRSKPTCTDIVLFVQLDGNPRNLVNCGLFKNYVQFFGLEELDCLHEEVVLRLGQNVLEVFEGEGFHLGANWHSSL